ncbi:helix-turn-helix domain-containing protein [Hymenobacter elongatus]|uniref:XRE family transcriptional regulator n=1 Tax=Hymenobacter elongatus TaxID=877208 RepID=A0A4Z0PR23_9BACT|nr:helix-turn-helix transcriptional regulator [Hymenobacter elongatus]TGE20160.1 XRE family transcriptional regulator [Hymenobacter elongatus]
MSSDTLPGQVRMLLGLTQLELAVHLRLSRERLAQVEIGRRSLPLEAMQRLLPFLEPLYGATTEPPLATTETEPPPADLEAVRWRLTVCRHEAVNARYQLTLLQQKTQPLRRRLVVLSPLLAALPPPPPDGRPDPDARDRRWYTDCLAAATDALARFGAVPQGLLDARIQALDAEIAALTRLLPPVAG